MTTILEEKTPAAPSFALKPLPRNYKKELKTKRIKKWSKMNARSHPLSLLYTAEIKDSSKTKKLHKIRNPPSSRIYDPLTGEEEKNGTTDEIIEIDPLTSMLIGSTASLMTNKPSTTSFRNKSSSRILRLDMDDEKDEIDASFESWRSKRAGILQKYTSNNRLAVTANFLDGSEDNTGGSEGDQLKKRVEELEMSKNEDEFYVSQTEYIKRMEHNVKRLRNAWNDGKRVLSLKIAIQSSKLLNESSVIKCPSFYPSMFILIADILDSFGELVYERLKLKAVGESGDNKALPIIKKKRFSKETIPAPDQKKIRKLRLHFTPVDVSIEARETCQNWFYKIACIRELSPRLFIELALFRCWQFIRERHEFLSILHRLSTMIRGIGDPLVAAYARAYLVHVGFSVLKEDMRPIILETFDDFLFIFNQIEKSSFKSVSAVNLGKIDQISYIELFTPCLDWIVQCIGYHANEEEFFALVQRYREGWNNSIILKYILAKFDDSFISKHAKGVSKLIKETFVTTVPRSELYLELGKAIVNIAPPKKNRLSLLNEIWKVVSKIKNAEEYVRVASVYIEYLLQHFGKKEIDILLGDVIKHLKKDLAFQSLQPYIFDIVSHILKYVTDFKELFTIMNFLPLIDMLESTHKLSACKMILQSYERQCGFISDAVLINSLMDVSRMLHNSINYLTFEDEKRQITELINHFIDSIDYEHNLEKQLNEYLECRSIFSNLDGVIYNLITKVGNLAMKAYGLMKGKHNKKTGAFVKACLAYCHVSIPSLELIWPRMYLFSNLGQIALTNQMIIQAEAFFIAAIHLVPKLPITFSAQYSNTVQSTSKLLAAYIATLTSTLLLMPGHPLQGPFYLVLQLLSAMDEWPVWAKENVSPEKTEAYLNIFHVFLTYAQEEFPYGIRGVDSNDVMYAQSANYCKECYTHVNTLGKKIHGQLIDLRESSKMLDKQSCGMLGLQFLDVIIDCVVADDKAVKIVCEIYEYIVLQAVNIDRKYLTNFLVHVEHKYPKVFSKLKRIEYDVNGIP